MATMATDPEAGRGDPEARATHFRDLTVAIWRGGTRYSRTAPYHPAVRYPESPVAETAAEDNPSYAGVRWCLRELGLDAARFGLPQWNPLGDLVPRGGKVVIKPNFVLSRHYEGGDIFAIVTHPATLRALVDYAYLAVGPEGRVIIADAPQMDCRFEELMEATQLPAVQEFYRRALRFDLEVLDLRDFWLDMQPGDEAGFSERRRSLSGDPLGSAWVDLGRHSAFAGAKNCAQFYGADYDRNETIALHHDETHRYRVSRTVLSADLLLSVPKLKVHKKVGTTLNAKGLVGITTTKNCLIHYTLGTPSNGGDQFPDGLLTARERLVSGGMRWLFDRLLAKRSRLHDRAYQTLATSYRAVVKPWLGGVAKEKQALDGGNWHGNDSAWRMVVDLMRIAHYADADGQIHPDPQRRILSIVDGIVGGENNGPLTPDARPVGVIAAGRNPFAVDVACTRLMGLDPMQLRWVPAMLEGPFFTELQSIDVRSDDERIRTMLTTRDPLLAFRPHAGWVGRVEVDR